MKSNPMKQLIANLSEYDLVKILIKANELKGGTQDEQARKDAE